MPPRPPTTGYERLAQADRFSDDSDDEGHEHEHGHAHVSFGAVQTSATAPRLVSTMASSLPTGSIYLPTTGGGVPTSGSRRPHSYVQPSSRRRRANSGVDLKAINARLERWADEIAAKFKMNSRRRGSDANEEERLEIHYSVFQAPEGVRPVTAESLAQAALAAETEEATNEGTHMSKAQFEAIVESVRTAIRQGVHPRMISQGSSGSYFARNPDGKVVGVFKPKDEEPYAAGNPKWNKWIHRNLFPCCFGRACLIPNLSYVSEAAAYVLDAQLRTHMVPYTDVVYLSSRSFHYPFWDRYAHSRHRKQLPSKPGSFQVFLKGFKDANIFLREHPWPDQYLSGYRTDRRRGGRRRNRWADNCRPRSSKATRSHGTRSSHGANGTNGEYRAPGGAGGGDNNYEDDAYDSYSDNEEGEGEREAMLSPEHFVWTEPLKEAFREELEKLVILDYIMRNTDRGLDNWMIKVDWSTQEVAIVSEPMHLQMEGQENAPGSPEESLGPRPVDLSQRATSDNRTAPYPSYRTQQPMKASSAASDGHGQGGVPQPKITIGAIDNSLSWPWKHPDAWRSFPFGWLFLPVDLIGRPFSQKTRDHFLPLLTSTAWWSQTQLALRRIFQMDPDFQERMFARQMAVMKGQAWNVVETLKTADHGPLELTRRAKVCVWDDLVEVPIAVPMRATSSEMRRRAESEIARAMEEEMDIGAAGAAADEAAGTADRAEGSAGRQTMHKPNLSDDLLLGGTSPPPQASPAARLPRPGRFELSKETVAEEEGSGKGADGGEEDDLVVMGGAGHDYLTSSPPGGSGRRAGRSSAAAAAALNMYTPQHERRYSYTTAASRRNSNSIAQALYNSSGGPSTTAMLGGSSSSSGPAGGTGAPGLQQGFRMPAAEGYVYDEDIEGDLGYAAAEGMENNRRRVIVERLEPVKSKNPVFTWC